MPAGLRTYVSAKHTQQVQVTVGGVDAGAVARWFRGGSIRWKNAVVDTVGIGVGIGPIAIVEVGPKLDLVGGNARGERNGDGDDIVAHFIEIELTGGVVGVEGAGGGGGDGEGGRGHRGGDGEGKGAGRGGGLGGGAGAAAVVIDVGGAGEGRVEGGGKIVFHEGSKRGRSGDAAFPELAEVAAAVGGFVGVPVEGRRLPGSSGDPVIESPAGLVVAAGGFVDALIESDTGAGARIEGIPHGGWIGQTRTGFTRNVPDIPQLGLGGSRQEKQKSGRYAFHGIKNISTAEGDLPVEFW